MMRVIVCGAGVIGASVGYFLTKLGADVVVVERTGVANASSGRAGAFLAFDWCAGSPLDRLARRSFTLHAQLAEELGNSWGYQRVTSYSAAAGAGDRSRRQRGRAGLGWLADGVAVTGQIGSAETTATVHPRLFTEALLGAARARGAELRIGEVTGIVRSEDGAAVRGVAIGSGGADGDGGQGGAVVEADAVVIAMGPWSVLASGWLPLPAVHAYKGHSLIFETGDAVPPEALFLEYQDARGAVLGPEVFPRADGTTYVAVSTTQDALPIDPAQVQADPAALEHLATICERISPAFRRDRIVTRQACYRPVTQDGLPAIGRVPGVQGAYVATGHSVWGVLNAPATGEALAELIVEGAARSMDLRPFDPGRLPPVVTRTAR